MSKIEIDQLWVPETLDGVDAADFLAAVEVSRQVHRHIWGNDDLASSPAEMLQTCRDPYEWYVVLLARVNAEIVGQAGIALPLADDTRLAYVTLDILPSVQGHGVGRNLLQAAEQFVRGENRRVVVVESNHPAPTLAVAQEERLEAVSGSGSLPLSSREVDFAQRADYQLQQVEHFGTCAVPLAAPLLAGLKVEAAAAQHRGYALHQWLDRCPDEWVQDIARLEGDPGNDPHRTAQGAEPGFRTVDGVREAEAVVLSRGRRTLVTAVEDITDRRLTGFTSSTILSPSGDIAFQDETVVAEEYWGQQLGQLIMVANMELLATMFPHARTVYGWIASEDDCTAEGNWKLGFVPAGVTGQWRKDLDRLH